MSWISSPTRSSGLPDRVGVLGWARTPFGKFGGALRDIRLPELGARSVTAALQQSGISPDHIDECAIGVNFPGSERSVARQVALRSAIPDDRDSYTVDRACCSSLTALAHASRGIRLGESAIAVAGGVENLSRVPYFLEDLRFGSRLGDVTLADQLVISCPHTGIPRAVQASDEALANGVNREQQDEWALRSQHLYADALRAGFLADEIVPVLSEGGQCVLDADECPRPGTTIERLSALPTVNGSETITAGNAPNMASGSTAIVLSRLDTEATIQATLESWTRSAGHPAKIASIPEEAARRSLAKSGLTLADVHHIEINEAFAAVPLVTTLIMSGGDREAAERLRARVNPNGGAIAIGHPTGATAGRLVMTTIAALKRRGGGVGLVTICGGVGEAEAVVVRVDG